MYQDQSHTFQIKNFYIQTILNNKIKTTKWYMRFNIQNK